MTRELIMQKHNTLKFMETFLWPNIQCICVILQSTFVKNIFSVEAKVLPLPLRGSFFHPPQRLRSPSRTLPWPLAVAVPCRAPPPRTQAQCLRRTAERPQYRAPPAGSALLVPGSGAPRHAYTLAFLSVPPPSRYPSFPCSPHPPLRPPRPRLHSLGR